jgi:hypothetical protein
VGRFGRFAEGLGFSLASRQPPGPPVPSGGILSEGEKRDSKDDMPELPPPLNTNQGAVGAAEVTLLRSQRLGLGRGGSCPLPCHAEPWTLQLSGVVTSRSLSIEWAKRLIEGCLLSEPWGWAGHVSREQLRIHVELLSSPVLGPSNGALEVVDKFGGDGWGNLCSRGTTFESPF